MCCGYPGVYAALCTFPASCPAIGCFRKTSVRPPGLCHGRLVEQLRLQENLPICNGNDLEKQVMPFFYVLLGPAQNIHQGFRMKHIEAVESTQVMLALQPGLCPILKALQRGSWDSEHS